MASLEGLCPLHLTPFPARISPNGPVLFEQSVPGKQRKVTDWLSVAKWFIFNVTKQDTHLPMETQSRWIIRDSDGHLGKKKTGDRGEKERGEQKREEERRGEERRSGPSPKSYDFNSISEAPPIGPGVPI